jgi:hypothetical protein
MKLYRFAAIIVSSVLACSQAGIAQATARPTAPATDHDSGLQAEIINDPTLGGIKAFTVNIPVGWKFQGTVTADVGCNIPSPVFRAYSPDGLTEIRLLPSFSWEIQEKNASAPEGLSESQDCIYLNGTMTAAQFLDRYVGSLRAVHVVGPMSISEGYRQQLDQLISQMNAHELKDPKLRSQSTGDAAAERIEATNGSFTIEQRLRARVVCVTWPKAIAGKLGNCSARLDVLCAPKGQLDALVKLVDSNNLTTAKNDDLWLQRLVEEIRGDHMNHFDPYIPNRVAVASLYRQANDFGLIQRPRGGTRPLTPFARTQDPMTFDWADFVLDFEQPKDPDGTAHAANDPVLWSDSDGQHYRTDDPGANPNGVLTGQWTGEPEHEASVPR